MGSSATSRFAGHPAKRLVRVVDHVRVQAVETFIGEDDRARALLDAVMLVREQRKSLEQNFRRYFGDIASRGNIAATCHLGDLVGYAPWPDEVVRVLRIHDRAAVTQLACRQQL